MIQNRKIKIKIFPTNRKQYENKLGVNLVNNQVIEIKQSELLPTSRALVLCKCKLCETEFTRKRVDVKNRVFCGTKCRNKFLITVNPSLNIEMVNVSCGICKKDYEVHPSKHKKQENFFCSRECYAKHRSNTYRGVNTYNYQDIFIDCVTCHKEIKVSSWYLENKNNLFCSQECYWKHRQENYSELYYNPRARKNAPETKPERLVREWLDTHDIKYIQEAGFLRKYYVDFYLPDYNVILEAYGDYWHINPDIYDVNNNNTNKKKLSKQQEDILRKNHDKTRTKELEAYGFKIFVLWETDLYNDRDALMYETLKKIKTST